ncbi:MAG: hypothetical protein LBK68_04545 [Candidatus Margulisbacteria bacterium]|nr:hypothetical protein [Candidatus Margulisiibacteriota bacterium]
MSGINGINLDATGALSKWDTKSREIKEIGDPYHNHKTKNFTNLFPSIVDRPDGKIKIEDFIPVINDPEQSRAFLWDIITEAVHARNEGEQVKADELIDLSLSFTKLSSIYHDIDKTLKQSSTTKIDIYSRINSIQNVMNSMFGKDKDIFLRIDGIDK